MVQFDFRMDSVQGIKRGEKLKWKYENLGYTLVQTIIIGDICRMIWKV